ncbi:hypothetical protein [Tateyamaria sp. Alg231-49]|uniref:hypothetical protein n=1 Tax=Tateyamaria sp. Alg231-49 TaxID=1922219 RepID=UPI00131F3988|nr:hypothetical protein [Tateyamaria sp. Alg231-49]
MTDDAPELDAAAPHPITQKMKDASRDAAGAKKTKLTSVNDKNRPIGPPKNMGKFT